jgi:hypothetical protein
MNDELERMWKEAILTKFGPLSQHSSGGTEEEAESQAEIRTEHFLNTYQKVYRLRKSVSTEMHTDVCKVKVHLTYV